MVRPVFHRYIRPKIVDNNLSRVYPVNIVWKTMHTGHVSCLLDGSLACVSYSVTSLCQLIIIQPPLLVAPIRPFDGRSVQRSRSGLDRKDPACLLAVFRVMTSLNFGSQYNLAVFEPFSSLDIRAPKIVVMSTMNFKYFTSFTMTSS